MAPEALHDRISNKKTDVVSLLLCRAEPALKCIMIYHTVRKFGKLTFRTFGKRKFGELIDQLIGY